MQTFSPFSDMPEYAFPRLRKLLSNIKSVTDPIDMSIGEPKHPYPKFIEEIINSNLTGLNKYPPNDGYESFLESIGDWVKFRYEVPEFDHRNRVTILNGSREGIFNSTLSLFPRLRGSKKKYIILPNPFYQCYLAACIAANAEPIFVSSRAENNFLPDYNEIPKNILDKTGIFFVCSPSNPYGSSASPEYWKGLISLSEKYNFRIFSDECYSEIYRKIKPVGLLSVGEKVGADKEKISIFQSLSKRSNLPGIRSGFSINGSKTTQILRKVRAYGGAPLPIPFQVASEKLWRDEKHVQLNRVKYNKKFVLAKSIFQGPYNYEIPGAGFFMCVRVNNSERFTQNLWAQTGVKVLPGSYLCNLEKLSDTEATKISSFVRIALVGSEKQIDDGLNRITNFLHSNASFKLEQH